MGNQESMVSLEKSDPYQLNVYFYKTDFVTHKGIDINKMLSELEINRWLRGLQKNKI